MKKALSFLTVLVLLVGLLAVFPVSADVWDGTTADEFAGGSGTEDDPYQIATAEQLAAIAKNVNFKGEKYRGVFFKQTADIQLNDISNYENWATLAPANVWTPIGTPEKPFFGTYDGNGKTISGMYIGKTMVENIEGYGLFAATKRARLINITVENAYLAIKTASTSTTTDLYVGGIVGYSDNTELINCSFDGNIKVTRDQHTWVAGIVGRAEEVSTMRFVKVSGSIELVTTKFTQDGNCVGGICGRLSGLSKIDGAINTMNITGGSEVGGIAGHMGGGDLAGIIYNAVNTGNVAGDYNVGGIAGRAGHVAYAELIGCVTTGTVSATDKQNEKPVLVGYISGAVRYITTITNCYYVATGSGTPAYNSYVDGADNAVVSNVAEKTAEELKADAALALDGISKDIFIANSDGTFGFNAEGIAAALAPEEEPADTTDPTEETEEQGETDTAATTTNKAPTTPEEQESGCGSSVLGMGVVFTMSVCIAAVTVVSKKGKENA